MASLKNIVVPDVGSSADVVVIEVLVKPGDRIQKDTPLVTLESDKATMEVPSTDAGTVKTLKIKVNDKVKTGSALVVLETEEEAAAVAAPVITPAIEKKSAPAAVLSAQRVPQPLAAAAAPAKTTDVHAGPAVRRMARELGVDLTHVQGSGLKNRITREDMDAWVPFPSPIPATAAPSVDFAQYGSVAMQPLSRIKKIAGKNLLHNWMTIPHVTQLGEADITDMEAYRTAQKAALEKQSIRLTPLVFIMKAVVACLKAYPLFNASLDASGENLVMKHYFHLGIAVDTPDGLVVPVIRDVDQKGLVDLAKELAMISEKARKKQLLPRDMQGGSFSISSLGGIGGTAFTPIINAPEVAILGISKSYYKPVYQDGHFVPRFMLPLSLSYDHRVIDGADGARFMAKLTELLSDIRHLLL